ncbi:ParA family protein [Vibrio sp. HN007]|uniref:ParA family protein n=1 Tax=Vibrio iocasae TaxID=3098914 RepID=UPI0035D51862
MSRFLPWNVRQKETVGLHYSKAKKVLVMNQKGGVGKSTLVAGTVSHLMQLGYRVELVDFDKQKSSYDWAHVVNPDRSQAYNPSLRNLSDMASTLRVHRDTDFVILDSPSNFTTEDMMRYTYFVNGIVLPMSPSPVDLHASLPFIKCIMDSGILSKRKIALSFVINRYYRDDNRGERVRQLLKYFRHFPTLGRLSEDLAYQEAFFNKVHIDTSIDKKLWDDLVTWLQRI